MDCCKHRCSWVLADCHSHSPPAKRVYYSLRCHFIPFYHAWCNFLLFPFSYFPSAPPPHHHRSFFFKIRIIFFLSDKEEKKTRWLEIRSCKFNHLLNSVCPYSIMGSTSVIKPCTGNFWKTLNVYFLFWPIWPINSVCWKFRFFDNQSFLWHFVLYIEKVVKDETH